MRHCIGLLLAALLFLCGSALAAEEFPEKLENGEFVSADSEAGVWRYASNTLKVEIYRRTSEEPRRIWYEAEVWSTKEVWGIVTAAEGKHISATDWPTNVAKRNGSVLAINGDYATARYSRRNNTVGILIREGSIVLSKKTMPSANMNFPNLDTLALFPDGNMQVFGSKDHTAAEYLEMGVTDVLAFGPWLIRDGEINPKAYKLGKGNAMRTAIGMVRPGHYFAITVEARHKGSRGSSVAFCAERLRELGCRTAFNLDGGETACMLFMGEQLNYVGSANNRMHWARRTSELLAIGASRLVNSGE